MLGNIQNIAFQYFIRKIKSNFKELKFINLFLVIFEIKGTFYVWIVKKLQKVFKIAFNSISIS